MKRLKETITDLRRETARTLRDLDDGQLLARFVETHDEAAFSVLVQRHARMTLGVCQRSLHSLHDAEDACQAVFLILAKRASVIRSQRSLHSWLHGVALRVTANFKKSRSRRTQLEQQSRSATVADPSKELTWKEVREALDEELAQLPARHREAFILCHLEGLTRDEAARRMKISAGALHGLLERGRKMLAQRLSHRGMTLNSAMLASALGESVSISTAMVVKTTKMALGECISPSVEMLSGCILKEMAMATSKWIAVSVVGVLALSCVVGFGVAQEPAAKKSPTTTIRPAESDEEFLRRLSHDLRGSEPNALEVHFFVHSKDPKKRETLIDLLIKERQAKGKVALDDSPSFLLHHGNQKLAVNAFHRQELTFALGSFDERYLIYDTTGQFILAWRDSFGDMITDAVTKSEIGKHFKPITSPTWTTSKTGAKVLTIKLEALQSVDLGSLDKRYQLLLFAKDGTLSRSGTLSFGNSVVIEKGEFVVVTFADLAAEEPEPTIKAVIRKAAKQLSAK
jgi:RNA polymerase sigma factor (sigma-70 family)